MQADEKRAADHASDFGDSAGYGRRGSGLDRDAAGNAVPPGEGRPNPLDAVVKARTPGADDAGTTDATTETDT